MIEEEIRVAYRIDRREGILHFESRALRISVDNKEYLFIGYDDRFSEQLREEGRIGRRKVWHCSSG